MIIVAKMRTNLSEKIEDQSDEGEAEVSGHQDNLGIDLKMVRVEDEADAE